MAQGIVAYLDILCIHLNTDSVARIDNAVLAHVVALHCDEGEGDGANPFGTMYKAKSLANRLRLRSWHCTQVTTISHCAQYTHDLRTGFQRCDNATTIGR